MYSGEMVVFFELSLVSHNIAVQRHYKFACSCNSHCVVCLTAKDYRNTNKTCSLLIAYRKSFCLMSVNFLARAQGDDDGCNHKSQNNIISELCVKFYMPRGRK